MVWIVAHAIVYSCCEGWLGLPLPKVGASVPRKESVFPKGSWLPCCLIPIQVTLPALLTFLVARNAIGRIDIGTESIQETMGKCGAVCDDLGKPFFYMIP